MSETLGRGVSAGRIVTATVAAMLIVPLIGVAVVSAVYVVDGDRRAEAARERLEAAELAGAATDALVSEQAWAGLEALGASEAVSVDDPVPHTDEAAAALLTALDAWSDETAEPYRAAVDGLAELPAIRAEVAVAPDGTLAGGAADAAADPGRLYDPLIDAFHDAADVAALSIDDPDERRGADLIALIPEQTQSGDRLQRTLLLLGTGASTADTPEEITVIAAQLARWEAGLARIRAAEEPYAALVDEHLPADDVAALSSVVDGVLTAGEPVDVTTVLAVDVSMIDLETAVADRHAAIVARSASDADDDERRALMLGGVALAGALALAVLAVVVVATGRRPPPGAAGPEGTAASPTPVGVQSGPL